MELENRGGARAKVDKVEIKQLNSIKRSENNSFLVDAEWLVSGSVNHFGHTHYRRNYYHSLVTIAIVDDVWKIQNIELVEEKRLL